MKTCIECGKRLFFARSVYVRPKRFKFEPISSTGYVCRECYFKNINLVIGEHTNNISEIYDEIRELQKKFIEQEANETTGKVSEIDE